MEIMGRKKINLLAKEMKSDTRVVISFQQIKQLYDEDTYPF